MVWALASADFSSSLQILKVEKYFRIEAFYRVVKTLKIWLVVDEERVSNLRRHCCVLKLSLFRAYALLASLLSTVHSLSSFYFVSHYSCSFHDCTAGLSRFSFLIFGNRKKQLYVNAESEIENNSAWEKVIGVVVRHLNFGWEEFA